MTRALIAALLLLAAGSCSRPDRPRLTGQPVEIKVPLGLPPLSYPAGDAPTAEAIALGRKLFYDTRLSGDNSISCASCHNPALHFSDRQAVSTGMGGRKGVRNALTVLNAAYQPTQFWDGRAATLEEQAAGPIANPLEMNHPHDVCVSKLAADPDYRRQFEETFGKGPVTLEKIERAIASFERTLLSGNSAFDRYMYGGDRAALSPAAVRGLRVFTDATKGNCVTCHTIGEHDALFTDGKFHNLGTGMNSSGDFTDLGRYEQTKNEHDRGAFKTPSLRGVALTPPYMHDGSLKTLKDVVDFYDGGGNSNPQLDREIRPLHLTREERQDLVEFLESLTGDIPVGSGPPTRP